MSNHLEHPAPNGVSADPEDQATRDRLLQAGIREFALRGYDGATVREICSQAAANVNAVKYYFGDKRGLYVAVLQWAHQRGSQEMRPPAVDGQGAEDRLKAFIRGMLTMLMRAEEADELHHLLMMREMAQPTAATAALVREFIEPRFRLLSELLDELLPPETSVLRRRMMAFSVVGQCLHYRVAKPVIQALLDPRQQQALTRDVVADHIHQVIMAAVRAA
jgi:AcrR family transcriptional regulator